jgi:hypothetical protein
MAWVSLPFEISKKVILGESNREENWGILVQASEREGVKGEKDTYEISLLKQLKAKVDAWLKSLNERIEREDVTRFEVRFLEILRNILEWVKEKIDAIGPQEEKKLKKEGEKRMTP